MLFLSHLDIQTPENKLNKEIDLHHGKISGTVAKKVIFQLLELKSEKPLILNK